MVIIFSWWDHPSYSCIISPQRNQKQTGKKSSSVGEPLENSDCSLQLVELNKLKNRAQWRNPLQNYGCSLQLVEPAVLLFGLSTFSEILAKHQRISRIVSVGPGLIISLCCQFFPLALLNWYFVCWGSALVTVGRASLPYLVWSIHRWKSWGAFPYSDTYQGKQYFGFICGVGFLFVASSFLLYCWLGISSIEGLHLWLLGALVYLILFVIYTVENSWGVDWIYRYLPRKKIFWFDLCGWIPTIIGYFPHWRL